MKVWIFNPYGSLPGEGWSQYRSTSIARALTARGHEVVWWVSDFEHRSKVRRALGEIDYGDGFSVRIVPSASYSRHISWARVKYERSYASNLYQAVVSCGERPDVIIHGEPAVCFADLSMRAVRHCACPLIIDVIDLWPELFEIALHRHLRWAAKWILWPLYAKRRRFFLKASGFLAVSKDYLHLAQDISPGIPGRVAYLGTDVAAYRAAGPVGLRLPAKAPDEIWCIYVGTLGKNYDLPAVLDSSRSLVQKGIKIFIAGDGDMRNEVEERARSGDLQYLGRLPFNELVSIYPHFDIALACYAPGSTVSMPFKAFDYLAAGLPIVTSLAGDLGRFVRIQGVGAIYSAGCGASLTRAVLELASDKSRRNAAGKAAARLGASMDYGVQYSIAADFVENIVNKNH